MHSGYNKGVPLTTVVFHHCEKALEKIKTRAYIQDWEIVCLCTRCYRSTLFSINWKNRKKKCTNLLQLFLINLTYLFRVGWYMTEIWLSVQCLAFKEHRGQIFKTAKKKNLRKTFNFWSLVVKNLSFGFFHKLRCGPKGGIYVH